jgi:hypothetical protein
VSAPCSSLSLLLLLFFSALAVDTCSGAVRRASSLPSRRWRVRIRASEWDAWRATKRAGPVQLAGGVLSMVVYLSPRARGEDLRWIGFYKQSATRRVGGGPERSGGGPPTVGWGGGAHADAWPENRPSEASSL